ncbi:hypothetical protein NEOLEDRAFT_1227175 [Neolentinus lepideus HHB14362 ss-1]|uniref:Uncharacterized protein n=1 Tax=Neolentinus lepideus HHB14362 ss-1 TaxID=1314782 RepID=A0A165P8B7_9AGAM|nr:hypothetical protein NEOLEDRAFT_1227175 [Neolentinus lepideus HHB14362 ss-1]
MVSTRRSARHAQSPSPSVPLSNDVSPLFSNRTSVKSMTPATELSDAEPQHLSATKTNGKGKGKGTAVSTRTSRKRAAEEQTDEEEPLSTRGRAVKRRATQKAVVEVTTITKATARTTTTQTQRRANTKGKRGKAVEEADDSDEDKQPDEPQDISESDDSGSEFEMSDDDMSALEDGSTDDEEDETILVDEAIRQSLQTSNTDIATAGAGPSSGSRPGNARAALIAAAAERRLAAPKDQDVDDSVPDELDVLSEEEDEPLYKKGKKKQTKKSSKKKNSTFASDLLTLGDYEERREARRRAKAERNMLKVEENKLRYKLGGRKLTHAEKTAVALSLFHPELKDAWGDFEKKVAVVRPEKAEQPANLKAQLLPFQLESLYWMRKQEKGQYAGGMLADEMGMGKTIQMIALMVSNQHRPNLVVAPTVAIIQWKNEIEKHTDGMKVLVWHGSNRESSVAELEKHDVVLTTYSVLESSFRKQESGFKRKGQIIKEKSPVHAIKWHRIILDEAHNIKERATNTAKATFELQSTYKWCLSGTPLQNRVGELYSLIRFLGGDPFAYYFCKRCDCKSLHWKFSNKRHCDDCGHTPMHHTCFWNNEVLSPIQKNGMVGPGAVAFKKLRVLLDRLMLRRTKVERADDLGLPPRTVVVRRDYFSPEEKELYLSLFSDAKRAFNTYVDSGTVLNNYSNIFSLLTRMRQMACHPDLVLRSKNNQGKFLAEDVGEAPVCRLCHDVAEDAIHSKCRHLFDRECIRQYLDTVVGITPECPVCHVPLTVDLDAPAYEPEENTTVVRQGILGRLDLDKWRSSTKIEALIEELTNLRKQDATIKSIVFSQFVNFLDLIAFRLQKAGFNVCRLEGTMGPYARDATIKYFMNNVHVTVFLVSLKAGGVALNLTEASRVYLMDSWWNPAVKAMDRIHRLGQHRPVQAIKLVVEDSIESRIVQLQEKKSAMVDATLSTDDSAMGRLTPEDLGFLFRVCCLSSKRLVMLLTPYLALTHILCLPFRLH